MEKKIQIVTREVGQLKTGFGNPRKITAKKMKELENSLDTLGDFGVFVIDENDNLIAGNQRAAVLKKRDPHIQVTCKMLIGYTEAELRAVNLIDNTHAGEWDLDALAAWTSDLNIGIGIEPKKKKQIDERPIEEMELIHYEKYDYVMIVCNNQLDYNNLVRALGIEGAMVSISKRKINARAIWYHQMKAKIVPNDEIQGGQA